MGIAVGSGAKMRARRPRSKMARRVHIPEVSQQSPHPNPLPSEQERGPEVVPRKPLSAGPKPFAWSRPESARAEALGRSARCIFMLAWCPPANMQPSSKTAPAEPSPRELRSSVPSPIPSAEYGRGDRRCYSENGPLSAGAGVPPRRSAERSTRRRARCDTGPSRTDPAFSCLRGVR